MNNIDTTYMILSKRSIKDNILNSHITKMIYSVSKDVINNQIKMKRLFIRFKKRTVFPKKILKKTYYTLKNKVINREDQAILLF